MEKDIVGKDMDQEVLRLVGKNKWLNGYYDFMDGDPLEALEESGDFEDIVPVNNQQELWQKLRNYQGLYKFGNLYFANHMSYGCFVYIAKDRAEEFEHITFSDERKFYEWLERVRQIDRDTKTVDEFLKAYFNH
ncbi:hypothetical protein [Thermofilum sp.]|jgi:hypothetical protein|uniref:hypothetical protein n=1 Tax=Thermofilum sp. TaxID=1961369 RepID=UPI00258DC7FE|nr:hypothetical protein [Thermofilum sp.]